MGPAQRGRGTRCKLRGANGHLGSLSGKEPFGLRAELVEAVRQAQIPASICVVPGLTAEATPTSRKSDQTARHCPQVPLLTCLRAATRISTGCTGETASKHSLSGPASCRTRTGLPHQTHSRGRRHTPRRALPATEPDSLAEEFRHPARRADLVGQAGHNLLGPRGGGIRFGSSSGCC